MMQLLTPVSGEGLSKNAGVDGKRDGTNRFDSLTGLFGLLSDRTRLSILMLLARGQQNVSSICRELALPQPTVSHHLGLLRMNNLIVNRRAGKQVFYGLIGQADVGGQSLTFSVNGYSVQVSQANLDDAAI